jgi:dTDP-4-amino-4,6-dideoxygalactose transaminase
MNVPLLDLGPQYRALKDEIDAVVLEVLASTQYIMGPKVEALEAAVAEYCDTKHAIGVTSGTDALLIALMGLNVGPGDIVVSTPYTFFATAGTIARTHATPAFADINPKTFNLDPAKLQQWFDDNPDKHDKVKAIMPVHLFGQCADMDAILAVANQYNVPVIEDAAQAIGALYPSKDGDKKAGSMGLAGCFSFFPSKNLGCVGDGGMVVTNDDDFAVTLRRMRNHGMEPKYFHSMIGGNFRIDPLQAGVLSVKLPHLDSWHEQRRVNAAYYDEHLNVNGLQGPQLAYERRHHIYNQYILTLPTKRDEFREHLNAKGIGHDVYYPMPLHEQECFEYLGYKKGDFPVSKAVSQNTVAIPIYPDLTADHRNVVIEAVLAFDF